MHDVAIQKSDQRLQRTAYGAGAILSRGRCLMRAHLDAPHTEGETLPPTEALPDLRRGWGIEVENGAVSIAELERIKGCARICDYAAGETIFSQGEPAEAIYFIESGRVSIFIEEFNTKDEVQLLGPGEFFGEMAVLNWERRTASASAREDSRLLEIHKEELRELLQAEPAIAHKIHTLLAHRNEELALREKLIDTTGFDARQLHISIKGDPSLRESALFRERYESPVDRALPRLVEVWKELLLQRSAYRLYIGFNSGEVRIASILDPFNEEYHPATRLVDEGYLDRHFPRIDYERKIETVRRVFTTLRSAPFFDSLPGHLGNIFSRYYERWRPMAPDAVARAIDSLPTLRNIPNYYVRNITVSIIRDVIHMQFNCDGAHIVSAADYERFLRENL